MPEPIEASDGDHLEMLLKLSQYPTIAPSSILGLYMQDVVIAGETPTDIVGIKMGGTVIRDLEESEEIIFISLNPETLQGLIAALASLHEVMIERGKVSAAGVLEWEPERVGKEAI